MNTVDLSIRVASVLFWFTGVGFGMFIPSGIIYFVRHRQPMIVFGFPAYGGGPFERLGIKSSVWLLVAFGLVCIAEVVAGWMLWGGARAGAIVGLAALPFGIAFWYGFALPIPPLLAAVRTALLVMSWSKLR